MEQLNEPQEFEDEGIVIVDDLKEKEMNDIIV